MDIPRSQLSIRCLDIKHLIFLVVAVNLRSHCYLEGDFVIPVLIYYFTIPEENSLRYIYIYNSVHMNGHIQNKTCERRP